MKNYSQNTVIGEKECLLSNHYLSVFAIYSLSEEANSNTSILQKELTLKWGSAVSNVRWLRSRERIWEHRPLWPHTQPVFFSVSQQCLPELKATLWDMSKGATCYLLKRPYPREVPLLQVTSVNLPKTKRASFATIKGYKRISYSQSLLICIWWQI